jgi:mono/diheme cytochrome c family protein
MKRIISLLGLCALMGMFLSINASAEGTKKDGKAIFETLKCGMCHSVESAAITAKAGKKVTDLSKVGAEKNAEWFTKYLKKVADIKGKKHAPKFIGTEEELATISKWLETLKK